MLAAWCDVKATGLDENDAEAYEQAVATAVINAALMVFALAAHVAARLGAACGLADWLGDAGGFWGGGKHCQYLCDCGLHVDAGDDSAIDSCVVVHASVLAEAVAAP